jgi:lipopolysaccharide transport protein LptA
MRDRESDAVRGSFLLVFFVLVTSAWAESRPGVLTFVRGSDQPIEISAQKGGGRSIPGGWESTFKGNVKVKQGDLTLTCDQLTVVYEEKRSRNSRDSQKRNPQKNLEAASDIKSITAMGHVKIVQGDTVAVAGNAIYEHAKRTVTLREQPRLWQGGSRLQAETIVIYLDENRTEFFGGNGTVEGTLNPPMQQKEKEK